MAAVMEFLAAYSATLFAGAALYINVAEHPARLKLDARAAVVQWVPSYRRATWMQAPLAIVATVSSLGCWLAGSGGTWLAAAALIGLVVPFTFVVIMPTNKRLLANDRASSETHGLLRKWAMLHAVRTALSMTAATLMLADIAGR